MNGVPLPSKQLSGDEFEELVLMEVMRNTQVRHHTVIITLTAYSQISQRQ